MRAGAAEAGLHFVADQQRFMPGAPLPQRLHVLRRRESGAAALVGLEDDAGHVLRLHAVLAQAALEELERRVRRAEAIRERNLHEARVEVDDPFLERRNAAGLLRPQRAAVKRLVVRDDHVLGAAARFEAVRCGTA